MKKKSAVKNELSPADRALAASDRHTLDDLNLFPWNPHRIWAAQLMGLAYPNLGRQGNNQLHRSNVYPNAVQDTAIFLWLCTHKDDAEGDNDMSVSDAIRRPEEAAEQARKFGMERGLHLRDSQEFWDAYNKFWEVMQEFEKVATKPKTDGPDDTEDDHDPKV